MRSVLVVITNVLGQEPFQVALIDCNDMIKQISAATSHPTLGNPVLPGTLERGASWFAAQSSDRRHYFGAELGVAIKDQILGNGLKGKGFTQLLHHPGASRIAGDVEVQNAPAVVGNDKEAVQNSKCEGGTVKKSMAATASR